MRLPTAFQDVYREVAARHHCILIDGQSYFHAIGRAWSAGRSPISRRDAPVIAGSDRAGAGDLASAPRRRAFGWPEDSPAPVIDPARCAAHFGLVPGAWRYICVWGIMFYDRTAPIRYDSSQRLQKKLAFATAADRIDAGDAPESVGLPNVGVPAPVPVIPIIDTGPTTRRPRRCQRDTSESGRTSARIDRGDKGTLCSRERPRNRRLDR